MAITLTLLPNETLVRSGQQVDFTLSVENTDGSDRVISALTATPSPGPGGFPASIDITAGSGIDVANNDVARVYFGGVFFAQSPMYPESQTSSTVSFVVNAEIQSTAGAITSNNTSAVVSMSVIPQGSTIPNLYLGPYNTLDFESNNNGILYQGLHFV